jgi:hypothetical protein
MQAGRMPDQRPVFNDDLGWNAGAFTGGSQSSPGLKSGSRTPAESGRSELMNEASCKDAE